MDHARNLLHEFLLACRKGAARLLCGALLLLAASGARAAGLEVSGGINRARVRAGEGLVFTLRLKGPGSAMSQPALPPLSDFRLAGQYQTVETAADGGRVFAYHYLLTPTRAGRLLIPELSFRIGGETRTVAGFAVEVETAPEPPAPPAAAPSSAAAPAEAGADLALTGELSAPRAYLGQPVTYTLHLVTRQSVRNFEIVKRPDFQGFRKVEVPAPSSPPTRRLVRDAVTFLDVVILRYTLFPIEEGTLRVEPFEALLRAESREVLGRVDTLKIRGGGVALQTVALPAAPPGFGGAVGSFGLVLRGGPPARAELGQPFTLDYRIEGTGFLPDNPLRWTDSPFFTVYPATAQDESAFAEGAYRVKRNLRLSLLPKLAGDTALPRAALVYFDPAAGRYQTLETGGTRLEVHGGASSGAAAPALAPLVENPRPSRPPEPWVPLSLFPLLLSLPFAASVLLASGLWLYRTRFASPEKVRERHLLHAARRHLHQARRNLDVRRSAAFHGELTKALHAAMDLHTGRATAGLTRPALREVLREAGIGEEIAASHLGLLDQLESAEFAQETVGKRDLSARYDAVRRLLQEARRG